jgi:hypothetical protein
MEYIKPRITIISHPPEALLAGSGKYHYYRYSEDEKIPGIYDGSDTEAPSDWEEWWKKLGGHGYAPDGTKLFAKKRSMWDD